MAFDISHLFFSSFPGSILQTLPFAVVVSVVYWFLKYRKNETVSFANKLKKVLFVCYCAEVICMVFFFSSIRYFWGFLFLNNKPENIINVLFYYKGTVNFIPDFYKHISMESIMNVALFLPFGVLFPLAKNGGTWIKTVLTGIACTVCIETLQPAVGRSFDVNDMILNTIGVLISSTLFFLVSGIVKLCKKKSKNEEQIAETSS